MIQQLGKPIKVLSKQEENEYDQQMVLKYIEKSQQHFASFGNDQSITTIKFVDMLNLQELQLYFCYNLNFTRVPFSLTFLNIISCNVQKLDGLRLMKQLTKLRIFNNSTPFQLQELQYLTNLQLLDLNNSNVQDITPIKYLHLQSLILSRNNIDNIEALKHHKELLELNLNVNKVINLSPLQELIQLQSLEINENPIVHIDALRNLTQLQVLSLSETFVQDLTPIQQHLKRSEYQINYIKQPTQEQINHSLFFKNIQYLEDKKKMIYDVSQQFKQRILQFKQHVVKTYYQAVNDQQIFSYELSNLLKRQVETDTSFEQ
ncbi:Conserved_hypothetical protein [Hexamita inflata]|uniref:Uncharacterized protein n=1 Tax=Hexamita inflata TaxID=28002 RepID=A0AA86U121_9EUKA|nr:Conserved hypothetical protein [Hexamita inflata]